MKHFISIIIVNYNGKKWLKQCIDSLFQQTYKPYEIIIVDNNSEDGSVEYLKKNYKKITLIENDDNYGFAKGNNIGLEKAKGDYIVLLNNDTYVEKDFLKKMVHAFDEIPHLAIAQSQLVLMNNTNKLDTCGGFWTDTAFLYHVGNHKDKSISQYTSSFPVFTVKAASVIIKKSVIDTLGLFDDDFWCYYEETDFCQRAWLAGYECWYYPKATTYHAMGGTSLTFGNEIVQFHNFKNKLLSFLKNFETKNLLTIIPVYLLMNVILSIIWLLQGNYKNAASLYKAIYWNIKEFGNTMKKRQLVQRQRKIRDSEYLAKVKKNPRFSYYVTLLTRKFENYHDNL